MEVSNIDTAKITNMAVKATETLGIDGMSKEALTQLFNTKLSDGLQQLISANKDNTPKFLKDAADSIVANIVTDTDIPADMAAVTESTEANEAIDSLVQGIIDEVTDMIASDTGNDSWLLKLAKALGAIADQKLSNLVEATETLSTSADDDYGTNAAKLTAQSKIFSITMEATVNVLKTTGDGITTAARK